jgi:hypothetical protein
MYNFGNTFNQSSSCFQQAATTITRMKWSATHDKLNHICHSTIHNVMRTLQKNSACTITNFQHPKHFQDKLPHHNTHTHTHIYTHIWTLCHLCHSCIPGTLFIKWKHISKQAARFGQFSIMTSSSVCHPYNPVSWLDIWSLKVNSGQNVHGKYSNIKENLLAYLNVILCGNTRVVVFHAVWNMNTLHTKQCDLTL